MLWHTLTTEVAAHDFKTYKVQLSNLLLLEESFHVLRKKTLNPRSSYRQCTNRQEYLEGATVNFW
jgi:hypothetical protein